VFVENRSMMDLELGAKGNNVGICTDNRAWEREVVLKSWSTTSCRMMATMLVKCVACMVPKPRREQYPIVLMFSTDGNHVEALKKCDVFSMAMRTSQTREQGSSHFCE